MAGAGKEWVVFRVMVARLADRQSNENAGRTSDYNDSSQYLAPCALSIRGDVWDFSWTYLLLCSCNGLSD